MRIKSGMSSYQNNNYKVRNDYPPPSRQSRTSLDKPAAGSPSGGPATSSHIKEVDNYRLFQSQF